MAKEMFNLEKIQRSDHGLNMFPSKFMNYIVNIFCGYMIFLCKSILTFINRIFSSNFKNLGRSKFSMRAIFSSINSTSFRTIHDILLLISNFKMFRIYTRSIIAFMKNKKFIWDFTNKIFIRKSMSWFTKEDRITIRSNLTFPFPTFIFIHFDNFLQEFFWIILFSKFKIAIPITKSMVKSSIRNIFLEDFVTVITNKILHNLYYHDFSKQSRGRWVL